MTRSEDIARLWGEGHTAEKIGEMLGITKNAVVGQMYRMRQNGVDLPQRYRSRAPVVPEPLFQNPETTGCRYPLWGDEAPTQQFCGASRAHGKPYCAEHAKRTYVPYQPRARAAAE